MLERLRVHLRDSGLIPEGARVLVGYSGGADSTCLLHLLKEYGVDVAAAHLHHGQRPEADDELARCEAFCKELEIPFVSGQADVPRMARELKIGLEEAGRRARYTFLNRASYGLGCDWIATAHTRDDLIETVLLNLTRGCGTHGLTGIPQRRNHIVRPMLEFSREETREYCRSRALWFHDDPANADVSFSRARIRHRVLKELRAINPAVDEAIARMVEVVSEEDRFLNAMATSTLEHFEKPLNGALAFLTLDCEIAFDRLALAQQPPALVKRGLRLAVEALGGALDFAQTDLALAAPSGSVTAEQGQIVIEWDATTVHIRRLENEGPFRHPLTVPGETISQDLGWTIEAAPITATGAPKRADLTALLEPKKIQGALHFRSAAPGDSMRPLGFSGHRKLATLLSDAKLTRAARSRLPIICDMVGPVWAPGVCLDARVAAESSKGNVLMLQFGPVKRAEGHNVGNATQPANVTLT